MQLLLSILIALAATVFVVLGSIAGEVSKKVVVSISAISFVIFFVLSYILGLSDLVLNLL
jgi:hypothetical protein